MYLNIYIYIYNIASEILPNVIYEKTRMSLTHIYIYYILVHLHSSHLETELQSLLLINVIRAKHAQT